MITGTINFGLTANGTTRLVDQPLLFQLEYQEDGTVNFLSCTAGVSKEDLQEIMEAVLNFLQRNQ
jgi:hypothetical protein